MRPSESPETEKVLTDKEVFTKLWSEPRIVFKFLNDNRYDKFTHVLLILASIVRGVHQVSTENLSLPAALAIGVLGGVFSGLIIFYIYAAMMSWTGKWLKGVADTLSLLRVLAYSMIPFILFLIVLIPQIAIFGKDILESTIDMTHRSRITYSFYYISLLIELTLGIWTLCFIVVGISEVQHFSVAKSILNFLLPAFIIIGVISIIVFATS